MNFKDLKTITAVLVEYLEQQQNTKKCANYIEPKRLEQKFDLAIPQKGKSSAAIIEYIQQYLDLSIQTASPMFYNQLFAGASPAAIAGEWTVAATNTSMYTYEMAPAATMIEASLITHMGNHMGFDNAQGMFTTGGSNSNMLALLAARQRYFPTAKKQGTKSMMPIAIYISAEAHYSFEKAVNVLGLGTESIRSITTNEDGSMNIQALTEQIKTDKANNVLPFFIAGTAGTTAKGAYDDLVLLGNLAQENNAWFHIDGSWGGSVILSSRHKHLLNGSHLADSITWNPHKMMNVPLICSAFLLKDQKDFANAAYSGNTNYIFHDENHESCYDTGRISIQCGRRVDALKLFLAWQDLGDDGYAHKIDQIFELAKYAESIVIAHPNLKQESIRTSANICFTVLGKDIENQEQQNAYTFAIREYLKKQKGIYVNQCIINKNTRVIRLITTNPELTKVHIDQFFDAVLDAAKMVQQK